MLDQTEVTLNDDGRDLTFRIKKMPATKAFRFSALLFKEFLKLGVINNDLLKQEGDIFSALKQVMLNDGLQRLGEIEVEALERIAAMMIEFTEFKTGKAYTRLSWDTVDQYAPSLLTLLMLLQHAIMLNIGFLQNVSGLSIPTSAQEESNQGSSKPAMFLKS